LEEELVGGKPGGVGNEASAWDFGTGTGTGNGTGKGTGMGTGNGICFFSICWGKACCTGGGGVVDSYRAQRMSAPKGRLSMMPTRRSASSSFLKSTDAALPAPSRVIL